MPYLAILLASLDRLASLKRSRPNGVRTHYARVRDRVTVHADRAIASLALGAGTEAVRSTLDAACLLAEHGLPIDWRCAQLLTLTGVNAARFEMRNERHFDA